MEGVLGFVILAVAVLVLTGFARRRLGLAEAVRFLGVAVLFVGGAGLLAILSPKISYVAAWVSLVAATVFFLLTRKKLSKILSHSVAQVLCIGFMLFAFIGWIELFVGCASRSGWISIYTPVTTVMNRVGGEDWRAAHITADGSRIPDPHLMWRPVPWGPYHSQGFKGAFVDIPKPAGTFRIFTYGDSNVDGPDYGGWPIDLESYLKGRGLTSVQVTNAGVAGYSSLQGLRRFLEEVDQYRPDLVIVSFGWNDLPLTNGQADKDFTPPPIALSYLLKVLYRFQFYRALQAAVPAKPPKSEVLIPRVNLEDYLQNLTSFVAEGRKRNLPVVVLTRPHRESEEELTKNPTWRNQVPAYNEALRSLAKREGWRLYDAQRVISEKKWYVDECHFTREGYAEFAVLLGQYLEAML